MSSLGGMAGAGNAGRPPSVDALARSIEGSGLPHPLLVALARRAIAAGDPDHASSLADEARQTLLTLVINATGVLLHTNLGRAPSGLTLEAGAWNLELDLATGRRGSRQAHSALLVPPACGSEDALVTNNGAAAVLLVLASVAHGRPVVISRGELVEIGGGFRIPEILEIAGSQLIEVGTTNRTRLRDYERALRKHPDAGAILKVHTSNYKVIGFTESVGIEELAQLGPPVIADVGSGLLDADTPWLRAATPAWLASEPAVRQSLEKGAAVVTFSGDKLLGGPQAGIIAGSADIVKKCAEHPLARAFRPGILTLYALQEVLLKYLAREGHLIPFWRMAMMDTPSIRTRADQVAAATGHSAVACRSAIGAGSTPGVELESWGVTIVGDHLDELRAAPVPVIARLVKGDTVCDLRTVDPKDESALVSAIKALTPGN